MLPLTHTESVLLRYAEQHSVKTRVIYGQPQLLSEWMQDGVYGSEWVNMPTSFLQLRRFLGY
jgi:hypothetical protein